MRSRGPQANLIFGGEWGGRLFRLCILYFDLIYFFIFLLSILFYFSSFFYFIRYGGIYRSNIPKFIQNLLQFYLVNTLPHKVG